MRRILVRDFFQGKGDMKIVIMKILTQRLAIAQ